MPRTNRYSPEVRERAIRMVAEHRDECLSEWAAFTSIAAKLGMTAWHPGRSTDFYRSTSSLTQRAGLGHWHPHEMRHSAASIFACPRGAVGGGIRVVGALFDPHDEGCLPAI